MMPASTRFSEKTIGFEQELRAYFSPKDRFEECFRALEDWPEGLTPSFDSVDRDANLEAYIDKLTLIERAYDAYSLAKVQKDI